MTNKLAWSALSFAGCLGLFWFMTGSLAFAGTFLCLLMIHEMGHYVASKQIGMAVSLPVFTPLGAFINLEEAPRDAAQEAYMAMGGPLIGTIGALGAVILSVLTQSPEIGMAAFYGLWLNLFNLVPFSPLDGGRISQVISRHLWVLGLAALGYFAFTFTLSTMTIMVLVFIVMSGYKDVQYRNRLAATQPEYYELSSSLRLGYGLLYLGLAAFLFFGVANFPALLKFVVALAS